MPKLVGDDIQCALDSLEVRKANGFSRVSADFPFRQNLIVISVG
ncbi:MAG TPA: hypothetical protein V6D14_13975 [Coleofasciculaceae cyanobacterium]